ncbi:DUF4377 domain-containing protein [Weeksellaceae bacterium TAE3-ERU29]|nr:DUF4377 domain-containing protein [Weeksellaceae bacterium TAE3-ERU29]
MKYLKVLFLLLVIFSVSCTEKEESDYSKTVEITVLAETTFEKCCVPAPLTEQEDREAMIIKKKDGKTFTLFIGQIKGFTYEKGFQYKLLVNEKHIANPPQDGSSIEYSLIKELSKQKK